jgi:hypothetical protein
LVSDIFDLNLLNVTFPKHNLLKILSPRMVSQYRTPTGNATHVVWHGTLLVHGAPYVAGIRAINAAGLVATAAIDVTAPGRRTVPHVDF